MQSCAVCGGSIKTTTDKPYDYQESGLNIRLVGIPLHTCLSCGEEFFTIPNPEQLHKVIALDICKNKKSLLQPKEIVFLRKELNLKAKELARIMGADVSTISRWETGAQTIGESSDRLLRAIYLSCADDRCIPGNKCASILEIFQNLPRERKEIKEHILDLTPSQWGQPQVCAC